MRDPLRLGPPSPNLKRGVVGETRGATADVFFKKVSRSRSFIISSLLLLLRLQMASRQERRKAERDAAKRAPANAGSAGAAGAAGAGGAAAARADVNANPPGDWTTQEQDPTTMLRALGVKIVKQKAGAGDRGAQYSLGAMLICEADIAGGAGDLGMGSAGRSPKADVGLALCTVGKFRPLTRPRCIEWSHLMTKWFICG